MQARHPPHMRLVDHGLVPAYGRPLLVRPVERVFNPEGQGREGGAVPLVKGKVPLRAPDLVAEHLVGPPELPADRLGVGIQQELVRVESQALLGVIRSVDTEAVELPRCQPRDIGVPYPVGTLAQGNGARLGFVVRPVEQADLGGVGGRREKGEVDPLAVPGGSLRIGIARPRVRELGSQSAGSGGTSSFARW